MKKLFIFLFLILFAFTTLHSKEKVIFDTDFKMFSDDAYALAILANSGEVNILGATVVPGNVWQNEGIAYILRFLDIINHPEIPVAIGALEPLMGNRQAAIGAEELLWGGSIYTGAYSRPEPKSYISLGKYSEEPYGGYSKNKPINIGAVDFIANEIYKNPNEITIFAIGPCTNIALLVREYPYLVPLVKKIIYMGGAFEVPGNTTPAAEFNIWFDPEAAKICFRAPFKEQIIVPLDVCEKVFYTKNEYDRIVSGPQTPLVKMFRDLHGPIFDKDPDYKSFVWDSIAAAIFLQPDIVTHLEERYVDVDTIYGPDYGRTLSYKEINEQEINVEDKFGPDYGKSIGDGKGYPIGTQKAKIIFEIDTSKFWDLFINMMQR